MLRIEPIPAFSDNYIWALHDGEKAAVVDPGDAAPVMRWLNERGVELSAILITHHHPDHVGGIAELLAQGAVPVYGPGAENIPGRSIALAEGDKVALLAPEISLQVLEVPGHTLGHIAYYAEGMLFCGDTLFAGGCGRLFEGSPEQMHASLQKLAALPASTRVYCAHEYTLANLRFALKVEPENPALQQRLAHVQAQRERDEITLPSTLGVELQTNPFLRVTEAAVIRRAGEQAGHGLSSPAQVFAAVRAWKDRG
ncbi:hydroxyacylglutathione hydrolase [Alkalilimnicola sp. S0819]|uniref:hydroxyacylglutathione hydrolase n=1 Tax=Alkalilimnicola sp. S0819 TaxID=2613922 RepID=UPI001261F3CF|nr:hydroxyacylglutathione hydrolase [Alkalilimnicola sp. S0819]KAB7622552.1 hydroxyacylglutathione hydrolase [Alkalilimnicola sp. S0819]MPQ17439.1 hydroxyacylglutathione hydrolase [Alkalilimnicola sp. S0819]